jgi:hypothetical protein
VSAKPLAVELTMTKWHCALLLSGLLLALASPAHATMGALGVELRRDATQGLIPYAVPSTWRAGTAASDLWGPGTSPPIGRSSWSTSREPVGSQLDLRTAGADVDLAAQRRIFFRSWAALSLCEFALLGVTATLPREWTGWSDRFVQDGLGNLRQAYSGPPVWDTDHWFHNYVGHPYGGSVYYNTVRSQGASKTTSFLFVTLMSTQWEYVFEAVAEPPSIQDLIITPITGGLVGEFVHDLTLHLVRNGSGTLERIFITVLNPMHALHNGFTHE